MRETYPFGTLVDRRGRRFVRRSVFERIRAPRGKADEYILVNLDVYPDSTVRCQSYRTVESVIDALEEGRLVCQLPDGADVELPLCHIRSAREVRNYLEETELVKELRDLVEALNGRLDSSARCQAAYEAYLAAKTDRTRHDLRNAYFAVPKHLRHYILGDMDRKDMPIREALGLE